ncbi:MAG TPA: hypothetical protein PL084_09810 [Chitinophagales bacterium]|nr:hypothetical protein [Chitinophagales bacterium]
MRKIYLTEITESTLNHEMMPPQRYSKVATSPPAAPPMEVPAPHGVSYMC